MSSPDEFYSNDISQADNKPLCGVEFGPDCNRQICDLEQGHSPVRNFFGHWCDNPVPRPRKPLEHEVATLHETFERIGDWATTKIPQASWRGNLKHMQNEIKELRVELRKLDTLFAHWEDDDDTGELEQKVVDTMYELADLVILAGHMNALVNRRLPSHIRIPLSYAVQEKMAINEQRVWSDPDKDGVIHHV